MTSLMEEYNVAKSSASFVLKRSYFAAALSWQDILNYTYNETIAEDKYKKSHSQIYPEKNLILTTKGNVSILDPLYIKLLSNDSWKHLPGIKDFLNQLNCDFEISEGFDPKCSIYASRNCNCKSLWHSDGLVVSLADNGGMSRHNDIFDAGYIQLMGDSVWSLNDDEENVVLSPGDLLLITKDTPHAVWGNGPRSGLLLSYYE